jgi:hypothetical protein
LLRTADGLGSYSPIVAEFQGTNTTQPSGECGSA